MPLQSLALIGLLFVLNPLAGFAQKPDAQADVQANSKANPKTDARTDAKSDAKADAKTATAPSVKPSLTVTATGFKSQSLPQVISANGTLAAWQEAVIGSELAGVRLTEGLVNIGDQVRKGQVLARLDKRMIQNDVSQAEAALAEAKAQAEESALQLERAKNLRKEGFYSAAQVTSAQAQESSSQARVQSAKAALQTHQLRLELTEIKASEPGIISARQAAVGALASGASELFRLIIQGRIEWRAEVTASELAQVRIGQTVKMVSASGAKLNGVVRQVAPVVDAASRNAIVYVDLEPSPRSVHAMPGMFAKGDIATGRKNARTLPLSAIVMRDGFAFVCVIENTPGKALAKVRQVRLTLGQSFGEQVEVFTDLPSTTQVVKQGAAFLSDGDTVRLAPGGL